jgi:radical SAM protein (TIGR01212 family)
MAPFVQYKAWMIDRYGEALFRVPVQLAGSCPHGRCAFCSENGSKAQQTLNQQSPAEQIEAAIRFCKRRYKAQKLMLYFQAFTTDLTNPEQQQVIVQCLKPAAQGLGFVFEGSEHLKFDAVSIGTRPDCLPPAALDFLESLKRANPARHEVWVELGVQTTNDATLQRINRGHDWACSRQAILDLAERGIHVAPHVILGLPGETPEDWNNTAQELAKLPISGIKIHNLHVMKGTALADNPPPTLSHWEYAEGLMDFLRRIPADIPVMRISTDTPDDQLIAPHWHLEKGQFLDYVIQQMTMREFHQGDLCQGRDSCPQPSADASERSPYPVVPTDDGSITFFSNDWKEHYHTKAGARLEADKKFVEPSGLAEKLKTRDIKLLDVCFGLGNNALAALCAAQRADRNVCSTIRAAGKMPASHSLDITALEMDKRVVRAAAECFQGLETDPVEWKQVLNDLLQHSTAHLPQATISLRRGDARYLIQNLEDKIFDFVFHDPFSSQHCPELWTVEFFRQLRRVMKPDGVLLTYSSSMPVRGAMREAGLCIAETEPGHQMGNGTIASPSALPETFPPIGKLDDRRSIPYRDEFLCATSKAVLRQRQEAVEAYRD